MSMSKMRDVNLTKADGGPKGDEYEVEVGAGISLIEFYTILGGNWKGLGADGPLGFQGGSCPSVGLTGLVSGGGMGLHSAAHNLQLLAKSMLLYVPICRKSAPGSV